MLEIHTFERAIDIRRYIASHQEIKCVASFKDGTWVFSNTMVQLIEFIVGKLNLIKDYAKVGVQIAYSSSADPITWPAGQTTRTASGEGGQWVIKNAQSELTANVNWEIHAPTKKEALASFMGNLGFYIQMYLTDPTIYELQNGGLLILDSYLSDLHRKEMHWINGHKKIA